MPLNKEPKSTEKMAKEMKDFIEVFISMLRGMGAFAERMGKIEKAHPEAFKTMAEIGSSPEALNEFVSSAPPQVVGLLLKVIVRMSSLGSKMSKKMTDLSADEKIAIGKEFKQLADDLSELVKRAEE